MKPEESRPAGLEPWRELRRRRRWLLAAAVAGLALFLASFPVAKARHSGKVLYAGLIAGIVVVAWGTGPLFGFPCPQCGEPFTHDGRRRDAFTRKCLHCRHSLEGPGGPEEPGGR